MADPQPPVGIDLGTTFSVIAYLDKTGNPQTIPNSEGDLTTPSVVLFEDDLDTVGKEAAKAATLEPERVAQFAKREFGNPFFSRTINGQQYPPEVIQSRVLVKLKRDAEEVIGPIRNVVITVPAYFTEPRRKATQDAGRLAGLHVLDIINEPTAAAIAYGVKKGFLDQGGAAKEFERVFIYDLGGGTFDATIMTIDGKAYTVVATDGDAKLGGIDWDQHVADYLAEQFVAKHGADPRLDPAGMQRLLRDAEDAKRALSAKTSVTIPHEYRGMGCKITLTREKFADLTASLLDRTRYTVAGLLEEANLQWSDITRLLLVGGSTRMPMVAEMLEDLSGKKVDRSLSADESVAHGAAVYAGFLSSASGLRFQHLQVTNVNSHTLGVLAIDPETRRPRNVVLIPKNRPLPVTASKRFRVDSSEQKRVGANSQTSLTVRVIEGGDESGQNSSEIGKCVIRGLPGNLPPDTRVVVAFTYEANGRLTVHASVPGFKTGASVEIERASGMPDASINEWVEKLACDQPAPPIADNSEKALLDERAGVKEPRLAVNEDPQATTPSPTQVLKQPVNHEVESLLRAIRISWEGRNWESCITNAQQLLGCEAASDADKAEACLMMGPAYREVGQAGTEVDVLEEAVQLTPNSCKALSALAECYWRVGNREQARTIAQKCLAIFPTEETCRRILAALE